jgi:hypothetical protein
MHFKDAQDSHVPTRPLQPLRLVHSVDAAEQDVERLTIEKHDADFLVRRLRQDLSAAIESATRKAEALVLAQRRSGRG